MRATDFHEKGFACWVYRASARKVHQLSNFESLGFHLAWRLGNEPAEAFSFLGHFRNIDAVYAAQAEYFP